MAFISGQHYQRNLCVLVFMPNIRGPRYQTVMLVPRIIRGPRLCRVVRMIVVFGRTFFRPNCQWVVGGGGGWWWDGSEGLDAPEGTMPHLPNPCSPDPDASFAPCPPFLPVFPKTTIQPGTNSLQLSSAGLSQPVNEAFAVLSPKWCLRGQCSNSLVPGRNAV